MCGFCCHPEAAFQAEGSHEIWFDYAHHPELVEGLHYASLRSE